MEDENNKGKIVVLLIFAVLIAGIVLFVVMKNVGEKRECNINFPFSCKIKKISYGIGLSVKNIGEENLEIGEVFVMGCGSYKKDAVLKIKESLNVEINCLPKENFVSVQYKKENSRYYFIAPGNFSV